VTVISLLYLVREGKIMKKQTQKHSQQKELLLFQAS
jgi:hypothetical protein